MSTYDIVTSELAKYDGQKVRLTYRANPDVRQAGVVNVRWPRPDCMDICLGSYGGQSYGDVTHIEVKDGPRFRPVWVLPYCPMCGTRHMDPAKTVHDYCAVAADHHNN